MGLVLRQGTGLALSISILPPGCSQKKVASLMNTQEQPVRCYEVTAHGIRAVDVPEPTYLGAANLFSVLVFARSYFAIRIRPVKPRVAPRMAVGVTVA